MTDSGQLGANNPPDGNAPTGPLDCAAIEVWLAESGEETLPSAIAERLRAHAGGCAICQKKLVQARRGREWLLVLKQESLEPPAGIVAKILAGTSLAAASGTAAAVSDRMAPDFTVRHRPEDHRASDDNFPSHGATGDNAIWQDGDRRRLEDAEASYIGRNGAVPAGSSVPAWQRSPVVVLRRALFEPRLALVAAMAFFSISLTLNLMGVRLTNLRAADLAPKNIERAVNRQYAEANARVVRYYENLRIVYEVEARVQQMRRAATTGTQQEQEAKPRNQSSDSGGESSNGLEDAHHGALAGNSRWPENKHVGPSPALPYPMPVITGPRMDAAFHLPYFPKHYFSMRERRLA